MELRRQYSKGYGYQLFYVMSNALIADGLLDRVIGGWQLAGDGNMSRGYVTLSTSYFGPTGQPNGVMGVPADYKPAFNYVINMPANPQSSDPNYAYYDTNTVCVPLKDGTLRRTTFDNGLNPMMNQLIDGPRNWGLDASLFKLVRVSERFNIRVNADFFNVLNMPGLPGPSGGNGILSLQNSASSPRQLQLTLRLQW